MDAFPTQTVVSGLTILVSGTFTIDQDITFVDCVLFFHANADLVTSGVVDLVGLSTVFAPCDNAWNGIRINANGAIRLDNCTIRGAWRGIDLKRNYRAAMSMLHFNSFMQCEYGITAMEPLTDVFFSEFVLANPNFTYPCYGIIVYGGQSWGINLWGNTIDHTGTTGESFGIFLSGVEGEGNHLLWKNNSFGPAQCNYHLEKSRNVRYCENISHQGRRGFHFYGDNDNSFWSLSDIGRHGTGLLIQDMPNSMGRISEQVRKGNLWQPTGGSYGNYAAHCDGNASLSEFKIEDNSPEKFPTLIEPAMGWFIPDPGPEEVCTGITKPISTFESLLAAGTPPTTAAAEIWDAKRLLIGTLLRHPDLLTEDSVLNAFFLLHTDSTAGKFARLDQMVQEGGFSTNALWAVKDSLMTQFQAVKSTIDSLNARTVLSQLDSNLYYPADSMLPVQLLKWAALADSMDVIEASLSSLHAVVLAQALDSLAAITTTAPYEQAYKTLTSFRIKTAQGLEPEDAGYADLMDLANEDEAVYGGAVRHALHYLPICERYERIAPDETEDTEAERTSGTDARTAGPELILYPNPADNTIWVTQTNLERSTWSIFSTFGTPVRMGIWPEGQPTLPVDLQGIAPGAYYFVARNSAGGTKIGKFVVLR